MTKIDEFLMTNIQLHFKWVVLISILYICVNIFKNRRGFHTLFIALNYLPVLTHEIGHIIFNKISGGKPLDLVIVANPSERMETGQQGFAVTRSKDRLNQVITTLGGYIMPPVMLYLGFITVGHQYPSLFITAYLLIFVYFLLITSRKALPLLIIVLLIALLFFLLNNDNQLMMGYIVSVTQHFILGVLLGEVLLSCWVIVTLTFSKNDIEWDGSALKNLTLIPTFIFSTFWIVLNLYTVYYILGHQF